MSASIFLLPRLDRLHAIAPMHPIWAALGRADRETATLPLSMAVPHEVFDVVPAAFSEAAVTRRAELDDVGVDTWLRADPCWLQPDMNSLRMMACGDMRLTPQDAEDLAAVLRPLFGDAGLELSITHPDRWYLKLAMGAEAPQFSHPRDVLGDDVERHIPAGTSGLRWRRLLNEVQMSLHQHPVNRRREAAGMAPVNSLWFWGGGRVPNRVRARHVRCVSDDLILRGLAVQAGIVCRPLPKSLALLDSLVDSVIDLRTAEPAAVLDDWMAPALRLLRAGDVAAWAFGFAQGERFLMRRGHRWRFWRKPLLAAARTTS